MSTHFKGPVVSANGFVDGSGDNIVTGADLVAVTATAAEIDVTAAVTPGTAAANKAVVLGASKEIATITTATITNLTLTTLTSGATAVEINARADDSAMTETRTDAGAISITVAETLIVTTGAAAVTLAAPTKPGFVKVITMKTDGGDATLASTNIVGQSSGTTSITFNDAGDALVLISAVDKGKWIVLKESGVTAA